MIMKQKVIEDIKDFLNDFHYFKLEGHSAFFQKIDIGSKIVVINGTPYEDGLMLEIQLALKVDQIEEYIFRFYQQESDKLTLTYWESLSQIMEGIPKRSFIRNHLELQKFLAEIENALVKSGFSWLDRLSTIEQLSSYLVEVIFSNRKRPSNIFKLCQRSYLLRFLLKENITDAVFYDYYEQLQLLKAPEHQLEEFIAFKNFLKVSLK